MALKLLELLPSDHRGRIGRFECSCGKIIVTRVYDVERGKSKSCGCLRQKPRKSKKHAALTLIFNYLRQSAQRRKRSFTLTRLEVEELVTAPCIYCDAPPSNKWKARNRGVYRYSGIDRLDNSQGYVSGNVGSCCEVCNRAKGEMTSEQFAAYIQRAYRKLIDAYQKDKGLDFTFSSWQMRSSCCVAIT